MKVYSYLISDTDGCIEECIFKQMADAKARLEKDVTTCVAEERNADRDVQIFAMESYDTGAYADVRIAYSHNPDYAIYFSVTEEEVIE